MHLNVPCCLHWLGAPRLCHFLAILFSNFFWHIVLKSTRNVRWGREDSCRLPCLKRSAHLHYSLDKRTDLHLILVSSISRQGMETIQGIVEFLNDINSVPLVLSLHYLLPCILSHTYLKHLQKLHPFVLLIVNCAYLLPSKRVLICLLLQFWKHFSKP